MLEMKDYGQLVQQEMTVEEQIETALEFLQLAESMTHRSGGCLGWLRSSIATSTTTP